MSRVLYFLLPLKQRISSHFIQILCSSLNCYAQDFISSDVMKTKSKLNLE